ncbi:MAG: LuxR C-terminal-related transcriptional regulator [Pseudomonadota bacterium]
MTARTTSTVLLVICFIAQLVGLGLYGVQFFVSVFGVGFQTSWMFHEIAELAAFFALLIGVCLTAVVVSGFKKRQTKLEFQVDAASQRFQDVIVAQFGDWGFTEAEKEIGMLLIKGMSIAEIAELRNRSQATVKAQNTAIYQKSGLNNRAQLVSYFVEELTSGL